MSTIHNEFTEVEQPFIEQLVPMGWLHTEGDLEDPNTSHRSTFREALLKDDLRDALRRINLREDSPWMDESRVSQAISALERVAAPKLMEANQEATDLLLTGITVEGIPDWDQGRSRTVHYIDWENPENNVFRVINQFRVDEPIGQAKEFMVPDIVLFVNGIPVVVIECKSPATEEPIPEAIDQLRRYSNQRDEYEEDEGNERLFRTNQFVVATCYDEARVGTIGAESHHYLEWKDASPKRMDEVATDLGVARVSSQQMLIAGMLQPENLLDVIRHFTLFHQVSGRTVKIVGHYQQFRATQKAIHQLLTGKTRLEDGEYDRRGGIIWHTQGSGKSLTMVFLVRKMRSIAELRRFKVVVVTDRRDLQRQLSATAQLTGETVLIGRNVENVKELLRAEGPGIVFAMIQKYQERQDLVEFDHPVDLEEQLRAAEAEQPEYGSQPDTVMPPVVEEFPVLNEDDAILVLVDEAHRSHASALHANLLRALPNCARIGFTGTPIIMGAKKRTHEIFGEFIDRYTISQSEEDGSTVPILYEGRTAEGAVADGQDLDQLFEDMFADRTEKELEAIKQKYATRGSVMEAPQLIAEKARDILRHYVETILPNGLKAQVVACSRRAAVRYHAAFLDARDELVTELQAIPEADLQLDDVALEREPYRTQFLVRAHPHLDLIGRLEFAPVISGATNDDPSWRQWTERGQIEARIARFKKPLFHLEPDRRDPLAILIVKSMLLTGFDAPIEGAMYLDRPIKEAELLQAIARVNRTGHGKSAGIVVDYYGVAHHLKEALAAYSEEDVRGALRSLKDELPKLRDRHQRVVELFTTRGIPDINDTEACVVLLEDERLYAEFKVKLTLFLETLDLVLPRPEGLPYKADAKTLAFIYGRARNRYRRGGPPIGKEVGHKVRKLIDDHVISLGIDPKIPPISIMDHDFGSHVGREPSNRAKASEMAHAIRHHIRIHLGEDPVYFKKLSERLEEILSTLENNWDALVEQLSRFVEEVQAGRQVDETGLDPMIQAPFMAIIKEEMAGEEELSREDLERLVDITVELVGHVRDEVGIVGFWRKTEARNALRGWIFQYLDQHDIVPFDKLDGVADRLMELAKANHLKLVEA